MNNHRNKNVSYHPIPYPLGTECRGYLVNVIYCHDLSQNNFNQDMVLWWVITQLFDTNLTLVLVVTGKKECFCFFDAPSFFYTFSIIITYQSKQHDKNTSKNGFPINENFPLNKVVGVKKNKVCKTVYWVRVNSNSQQFLQLYRKSSLPLLQFGIDKKLFERKQFFKRLVW